MEEDRKLTNLIDRIDQYFFTKPLKPDRSVQSSMVIPNHKPQKSSYRIDHFHDLATNIYNKYTDQSSKFMEIRLSQIEKQKSMNEPFFLTSRVVPLMAPSITVTFLVLISTQNLNLTGFLIGILFISIVSYIFVFIDVKYFHPSLRLLFELDVETFVITFLLETS